MTLSEQTRLLNFIINILMDNNFLKYGIFEYKINIPDFGTVNPDFFVYLNYNDKNFNLNNYVIFEFKKRNVVSNNDLNNLDRQYNGFQKINIDYLDSSKIPVITSIPIFLNYIFHDTPLEIIDTINNQINFDENCSILYYSTNDRIIENYKIPVDHIFKKLNQFLVNGSKNKKYWKRLIIPFTIKDLEGIKGLGGNQSNIMISPNVSYSIILSRLCSFVLQRKIQGKGSTFHIEEFFDFLVSKIRNIIYIEDDERKSIIRKLMMFLNYVINVCEEENFNFIENKKTRSYIIKLRKNESIASRIENIRIKLIKKISRTIHRREITEFFE